MEALSAHTTQSYVAALCVSVSVQISVFLYIVCVHSCAHVHTFMYVEICSHTLCEYSISPVSTISYKPVDRISPMIDVDDVVKGTDELVRF